jgi:hypothetical protein
MPLIALTGLVIVWLAAIAVVAGLCMSAAAGDRLLLAAKTAGSAETGGLWLIA